LQHRRQGEPRWCFGGLATQGEQLLELTVLVDRAERVGDVQTKSAVGEGGKSHTAGLFWHGRRLF
jgi:hypothetical protein